MVSPKCFFFYLVKVWRKLIMVYCPSPRICPQFHVFTCALGWFKLFLGALIRYCIHPKISTYTYIQRRHENMCLFFTCAYCLTHPIPLIAKKVKLAIKSEVAHVGLFLGCAYLLLRCAYSLVYTVCKRRVIVGLAQECRNRLILLNGSALLN